MKNKIKILMMVVFFSGVLPCRGDTSSKIDTLLWHRNKIVYFILEKTANKSGYQNAKNETLTVGDNVEYMNSIVNSKFQLDVERLKTMGIPIGGYSDCMMALERVKKITPDSINNIFGKIKNPKIIETFPYEWYSKVYGADRAPVADRAPNHDALLDSIANCKHVLESSLSNTTFAISKLIWLIIILLLFLLIIISILFRWLKKGGKQVGSAKEEFGDISKLIKTIENLDVKTLTNSLIETQKSIEKLGDINRFENVLKRFDDAAGNIDVSVLMDNLNKMRNSILEAIVTVNGQDSLNTSIKTCQLTEVTHECAQSFQEPSTFIYCGFPDNNKIIRKAPDSSAERLVVEGSGFKASLSIVDKNIQTLIESFDSVKDCFQVREGSLKLGAKVKTLEKGLVEKVDDGWKVIKPIVIKFEA